jgi:release factor glutamine methyltransferase
VSAPVAAGSVGDAVTAATDALAAAGVETPRLDAELLLAEAAAVDRARLQAHPEVLLDPAAARRFGTMVRRRVGREPVAYILGRRGFRRIELSVDRRVLIPRPETELLVEVALELRPATVLDVGTGCGAVALSIADELADVAVVGTDRSLEALTVARANARRLGLADRVRLEHGTVPPGARFDLLVANLPYVAEAEWEGLAPEITRYEPREALVAGPTGLEAIESLLEAVGAREAASLGALALEVGAGQAPAVVDLVREAGFGSAGLRPDLAGIDRVVLGRP